MTVSILTNSGPVDVATLVADGEHYQVVAPGAPPQVLANGTVAWANSSSAGTEKLVTLAALASDALTPGRLLLVLVRNPSTQTAITAQLRIAWTDSGSTARWADLSTPGGQSTFTVLSNNGDGQAFFIDGGLLQAGGRLSLKNNTALNGSGGFTSHVQVHALCGV